MGNKKKRRDQFSPLRVFNPDLRGRNPLPFAEHWGWCASASSSPANLLTTLWHSLSSKQKSLIDSLFSGKLRVAFYPRICV
jgi:hypothetical protein